MHNSSNNKKTRMKYCFEVSYPFSPLKRLLYMFVCLKNFIFLHNYRKRRDVSSQEIQIQARNDSSVTFHVSPSVNYNNNAQQPMWLLYSSKKTQTSFHINHYSSNIYIYPCPCVFAFRPFEIQKSDYSFEIFCRSSKKQMI